MAVLRANHASMIGEEALERDAAEVETFAVILRVRVDRAQARNVVGMRQSAARGTSAANALRRSCSSSLVRSVRVTKLSSSVTDAVKDMVSMSVWDM